MLKILDFFGIQVYVFDYWTVRKSRSRIYKSWRKKSEISEVSELSAVLTWPLYCSMQQTAATALSDQLAVGHRHMDFSPKIFIALKFPV